MEADTRVELWGASFETFYDSYYEELLADSLINRWQLLDETAKVLVALTATGSVVSGWALWNQAYFKMIWSIVAGFAAILAILHPALRVPSRLTDWGEVKLYCAALRIDLETFRYRMQFDPEFPVTPFSDEFVAYRKRYGEGIQRLKNDILRTKRLQIRTQGELNQRIADKIIQE